MSHTNVAVETFREQILEVDASVDVDRVNYVGTIDSFVEKYLISPFYYLFHKLDRRPYNYGFDRKTAIPLGKDLARTPYPIFVNDIRCFIGQDGLVYKAKKSKNNNSYVDLPSEPVRDLFIRTINEFARYTHDMRWFIVYEIIKNINVLRCLANRFSEIIIDEAQDTREVAYTFFDRLKGAACDSLYISLIGDINQSIYSFSGATPESYMKFIDKWNLKKYKLTVNRRSYPEVVRGIDSLFGIKMEALPNDDKSGVYFISKSEYDEIGVEKILKSFNVSQSDYCVLSRHNNTAENRVALYIRNLFDACYKRDYQNNPKAAYREMINFVKAYGNPDFPNEDMVNPHIWEFVKNKTALPPLNMFWAEWRSKINVGLRGLAAKLAISDLGFAHLRKPKHLGDDQIIADFLRSDSEEQTVHSVKGETYDGVIFIDEKFQWRKFVKYETENDIIDDEELRIAYVAMTRARKFVLLVIPDEHLKKYKSKWEGKIRQILSETSQYNFSFQ